MANLYIGLLHYPMRNRQGEIVTTSMTSMDVHDIARSAKTYGVAQYYVVTPLESQREIARRIKGYYTEAERKAENSNRGEALELVLVLDKLEESVKDIEDREGDEPIMVGTSARRLKTVEEISYRELSARLSKEETKPVYVLFGTGWGIADDLMGSFDFLLPSIQGSGEYNHLSVRAAAAITLDKLHRTEGMG